MKATSNLTLDSLFSLGHLSLDFFAAALYGWTILSLPDRDTHQKILYLAGTLCILLAREIYDALSSRASTYALVDVVCILILVGQSIAFLARSSDILRNAVIYIICFVLPWLMMQNRELCRKLSLPFLIIILASFPAARILGAKTGGSYIAIGPIMIFGLVLMLFPFVSAKMLTAEEHAFLGGRITGVPVALVRYLLFVAGIFLGCAICNEFGLLLVLLLVTAGLFFKFSKRPLHKLVFTGLAIVLALTAMIASTHIRTRVMNWLAPASAIGTNRAGSAESILYLYRHIYQMGLYGNGIGNLSHRIYPTFNTDHALITLMNDYSLILAIGIMLITVLIVWMMLQIPAGHSSYDNILNTTCAWILAIIFMIDITSCLGTFITAGIGFPWISKGTGINAMLSWLVSIHVYLQKEVSR